MTILTSAQVQEIERLYISTLGIGTHFEQCWMYHPSCAIACVIASRQAVVADRDAARTKIDEQNTQLAKAALRLADLERQVREKEAECCEWMQRAGRAQADATRLRGCLENIGKDTVLDKQGADYYKRIMLVWKDWASQALAGKEGA